LNKQQKNHDETAQIKEIGKLQNVEFFSEKSDFSIKFHE
jgi:hypothetical protein